MIQSLKKSLKASKKKCVDLEKEKERLLTVLDGRDEKAEQAMKKIYDLQVDVSNGTVRENNLQASYKRLEKERNELMLESAKWRRGMEVKAKEPEPQMEKASAEVQLQRANERLKLKLREQHILVRETAAFAQGIMLAELVDNPSQNRGYDIGCTRLGGLVMASEKILLEE
jgi:FtsZ-binding cell division protein ZapB